MGVNSMWVLAIGTIAGGFARYYLAGFVYRLWGSAFPYGTLAVNLSGCFLKAALSSTDFIRG
jgi:CrcB protein